MTQHISILYTTIGSLKEAENLTRLALEGRYAACVNIIPGVQSLYLWDNKIESTAECSMIFKTTPNRLSNLEQWLLEHHPYDIPAILKWETETYNEFNGYMSESLC
jgi:periplasmic divalent cation tolerance protein